MTYEYTCLACHHEWEAEQSISENPLTECPSCHQASAKRMVSGGAGFILKGGGWYADGYGSSGGKSKSGDSKDSSKSSSSESSSDKKESKKVGESSSSGSDSSGKSDSGKSAAT